MKKFLQYIGITSSVLVFSAISCGGQRVNYDRGVYVSKNQNSWDFITVEERGREMSAIEDDLYKILTHPEEKSTVFIGGKSGLYKSRDAGSSWEKEGIGLSNVLSIDFGGIKKSTLYAIGINEEGKPELAKRDDIFDEESEWEMLYEHVIEGVSLRSVAVHPTNSNIVLLGTTAGEVLRSVDGGRNWGTVHRPGRSVTPAKFITFDRRNPNIVLFFANRSGIFLSRDSGQTFEQSSEDLSRIEGIDDIYSLGVDNSTPGRYYLSGASGVFFTNNYGESWERLDTLIIPGASPIYSIYVHPENGRNITIGTRAGILVSNDRGETWSSRVIENMESGGFTGFSLAEFEDDEGEMVEKFIGITNGSLSGGLFG